MSATVSWKYSVYDNNRPSQAHLCLHFQGRFQNSLNFGGGIDLLLDPYSIPQFDLTGQTAPLRREPRGSQGGSDFFVINTKMLWRRIHGLRMTVDSWLLIRILLSPTEQQIHG